MNPHHTRILCAKFGWNWPTGSGGDFYNWSMYFHCFAIISPWKRAGPFIWTNWIPFIHRCFGPGFIEISPQVVEIVNAFSLFCNNLPLEKSWGPLFEQIWIPFTQAKATLCRVWLKLTQWFWTRKKCEKFTMTTTMDNGQWTNCDQKSSLESLWVKTFHTKITFYKY